MCPPDNMIFFNSQSLQRGRRKHPRFNINRPVEFCEIHPDQTDPEKGITLNMSKGGMLFAAPFYVPTGAYILFKVIQPKPAKIIVCGLLKVNRVTKSVRSENIYETAGEIVHNFKSEADDGWRPLKESAMIILKKIAPEKQTAKTKTIEQIEATERKKISPMSFCAYCGVPVEEVNTLCADCLNRISSYFLMDRQDLYKRSRPKKVEDQLLSNSLNIIRKLGEKGDQSALPYLQKALFSANRQLSDAAENAIFKIQKRLAKS